MKIFKVSLVFSLFFCLSQLNSLSEAVVLDSGSKVSTEDSTPKASVGEPAKGFGQINSNQLFSIGEEIYRKTDMELETGESDGYVKTMTDLTIYTYVGFENNRIAILQENKYETDILDFSSSSEPKTEAKVKTKSLSLPVDDKKQVLLETVDGKELLITIIDEDNRITVEEL